MKISIKRIGWYISIFLFTLTLEGCGGKTAKQEKEKEVLSEALTDANSAKISSKEDSVTEIVSKKVGQMSTENVETSPSNYKQANIDLEKIYEQSEVNEAILPITNSQLGRLSQEHFKYPDIEPVDGKGLVDLVIETDGTVSDVVIVKGIHPEVDKEFRRVYMLLPKFIPGKIDGTAVRSKLRLPIICKTGEPEK